MQTASPSRLLPTCRLSIHPTALIDSGAEICDDAEIGPFAVIEAGTRIAKGCVVHGHAQLLGNVDIGENCEIGHSAIIGANPQDHGFDRRTPSQVQIGSGNVIREHVTIHRASAEGQATSIGDDNMLMVGCHLGHDTIIGDRNVLANHCLLGGHVKLGDGAFLGGGAAFHQFVRIGDLCMIKGQAAISQDVPPYVLASDSNELHGLNIIGMRRAGLSAATRQNVKDAFRQMFLSGNNLQEALDATLLLQWEPEALKFIDFFRAHSDRGVCHP